MARSLQNIPVITGPKRILTGKTAIDKFGADILICDDAFQHRQIFRDINLVLLDNEVKGKRLSAAAGQLREPLTALNRASALF